MLDEYLPYVLIAVITGMLIAATVVLARVAWRRQMSRYLMDLTRRREVVATGINSIGAVVQTLAGEDTDGLVAFAETDSEERTAFVEVAARMRIEAGDLEALALPKRLWPLADVLGQAAKALAEQTGAVGDASGLDCIEALADLDLAALRDLLAEADDEMRNMSDRYGLTDATIYSGVAGP